MQWTERVIAGALARQTFQRKAVVIADNCNWTGHECDLLCVTTDLRIIDVEVKISRADLRADAGKAKWWHHRGYNPYHEPPPPGVLREHPPRVWKHYYAMPASIWEPGLLDCLASPASGVLLVDVTRYGHIFARCERRAKPARDAYRLTNQQVMDIARLANLRMWSAYDKLDDYVRRSAA